MIGYGMSFSPVGGLYYGQDFSGRELQAWMEKKDMVANMATFFARNRLSFLGNLNPNP